MSAWIPFYKTKDKKTKNFIENFESELKQISASIKGLNQKQAQLSKQAITVKRRLLVYSITFYVIFVVYLSVVQGYSQINALQYGIVVGVPITIHFVMNLIGLYYNKRFNSMGSKVEQLKSEHKSKIDDLKEATNFSKTQDLLLKFTDDAEDLEVKRKQQEQFFEQLELQNSSIQPVQNLQMAKKSTIFDRLLTAVIGEDEMGPNNRYALICKNCAMHNGLAPPGTEPHHVKYVCAACGAMNNESAPAAAPVAPEADSGTTGKEDQDAPADAAVQVGDEKA